MATLTVRKLKVSSLDAPPTAVPTPQYYALNTSSGFLDVHLPETDVVYEADSVSSASGIRFIGGRPGQRVRMNITRASAFSIVVQFRPTSAGTSQVVSGLAANSGGVTVDTGSTINLVGGQIGSGDYFEVVCARNIDSGLLEWGGVIVSQGASSGFV